MGSNVGSMPVLACRTAAAVVGHPALLCIRTPPHIFYSSLSLPLPAVLCCAVLCCAAGEGWVSGYIVAPAQCGPSISARACQRCITSKAPEPCITCAKSPQLKARLLDTVYGGIYELNPADGCGACYSSAAPEKCAACLYGKQPCAACALQPENPGALAARMDVAACIDCR